ncbi:MAG: hypothetical protein R2856_11455 [Caldilineaceae bacterium]
MSTRPKSSATSSSADLPGLPRLGTEIFAGDLTMTVGGNAIVAAGLPHRLGAKVGLAADLGTDAFQLDRAPDFGRVGIGSVADPGTREHPLPQATVGLSFRRTVHLSPASPAPIIAAGSGAAAA